MRDQYVGDISDFFKYHFIRSVAGVRKVGVAWFYIPSHDGRNDGKHIEWRADPRFALCDPQLTGALSSLNERTIHAVEQSQFWPAGTVFHREPVPSNATRSKWSSAKRAVLNEADFIFCDPDNGIGLTNKHVMIDELRQLRREGRTVAFITFPARTPHHQQVVDLHERLHDETETRNIFTVRTSTSVLGPNGKQPRARWFTLLDGDHRTHEACRIFGERLQKQLGAKVHTHETNAG